jgi:hypothetical protein
VYLGSGPPYRWAYSRNLKEFTELPSDMQTPAMFVAGLRRRGYLQREDDEREGNGLWLEMPCRSDWAHEIRGSEHADVLRNYADAYTVHGRVIIQIDGALSPDLVQLFYEFPGAPADLAAYLVPGRALAVSGPVPRAPVMTIDDAAGPYAAFFAVPGCHDGSTWNESACEEPGGCEYERWAFEARQAYPSRPNKRSRVVSPK